MRTDGLASLKTRLRELDRAGRITVRVRLGVGEGAQLAELYREGEVLSREQEGDYYDVVVRLEPSQAARLRQTGMTVSDAPTERMRLRKASG